MAHEGARAPTWSVRADDPAYPAALAVLGDGRPDELHFRGQRDWPEGPRVAVVGARAATPYARHATRLVVAAAVARGSIVLSGAARGVDACAHRAALARGGFTVAVLGVGIDQVYPPEHASLYTAIARRGCLVSPWGAGEGVRRGRFPARNRVLAALADSVVLVQADARSGSAHTVRAALALGRPVWVVPWPLGREAYRGNADWAARDDPRVRVLARPGDALAARSIAPPQRVAAPRPAIAVAAAPASPRERMRAVLDARARSVDALARAAGLDTGAASAALIELEWTGAATRLPGDRYRRRPA